MTDYQILIANGHSAAKAAEIVLDANRGDAFCIGWIAVARDQVEKAKPRKEVDAL